MRKPRAKTTPKAKPGAKTPKPTVTLPVLFSISDNAIALRQTIVSGEVDHDGKQYELSMDMALPGTVIVEVKEKGAPAWRYYGINAEAIFTEALKHFIANPPKSNFLGGK